MCVTVCVDRGDHPVSYTHLDVYKRQPYAVGSLATTYTKYPNACGVLPAMGYSAEQIRDLSATIEATPADAIVSGTPIDLTRVLSVSKPIVRARYELREREPGLLSAALDAVLG